MSEPAVGARSRRDFFREAPLGATLRHDNAGVYVDTGARSNDEVMTRNMALWEVTVRELSAGRCKYCGGPTVALDTCGACRELLTAMVNRPYFSRLLRVDAEREAHEQYLRQIWDDDFTGGTGRGA